MDMRIPDLRRSPLFRPLIWSAGIHLAVLILFSVRAAGELRARPLSFLVNWAAVSRSEMSLVLAPADRPAPMIAPGTSRIEHTGSRVEPGRSAAVRLRDLPVPTQSGWVLERPEPGEAVGPGPDLRRVVAGAVAVVEPEDLAGIVSRFLPEERASPGGVAGEPGDVPVPEWRIPGTRQTPGVTAVELGVRGGESLLSRRVLAFRIPRWEEPGLPVVCRIRVAPDGRVTAVVPLTAGAAGRLSEASAALLEWRFAPVPARGEGDGMWGTVEFE